MAISDISLTAGMKSNLISLQNTAELMDRTQVRLTTGKRVNSVVDDPVNFFTAQSHMARASELSALKDGMAEAIQTIEAANNGIEAITALIETAKGIAQSAKTSSSVGTYETQYDALLSQIDTIALYDSGYKGVNFLDGTSQLIVNFNNEAAPANSSVTINAFDGTYAGLGITATGTTTWDDGTGGPDVTAIGNSIDELNTALDTLRANAESLSSNLNIITVRQDFTTNMINTLTTGADNLTLADTNEEGANMLMLQTRQQLGLTALNMSAEAAQSIIALFQ